MALNLPLAGLHVLVVEDDAILAFEMFDDLVAVGAIPIGPVATVQSALKEIAKAKRLDAALLNVRLRGEFSFPIADELMRRDVRFAFVTGYPGEMVGYPTVQVHAKPAKIADIVMSLKSPIANR